MIVSKQRNLIFGFIDKTIVAASASNRLQRARKSTHQ